MQPIVPASIPGKAVFHPALVGAVAFLLLGVLLFLQAGEAAALGIDRWFSLTHFLLLLAILNPVFHYTRCGRFRGIPSVQVLLLVGAILLQKLVNPLGGIRTAFSILLCSLAAFVLLRAICRDFIRSPAVRWTLYGVLVLKIFLIAVTCHYDLYRFLVFFQNYLAQGFGNPYLIPASGPIATDFPYPPALFYLVTSFTTLVPHTFDLQNDQTMNLWSMFTLQMPVLFADLALFRCILTLAETKTRNVAALLWFVCPMVLHRQFFAGQYDLIALFPLTLAFEALVHRKPNRFALFFAMSLALKPVAILTTPVLFVLLLRLGSPTRRKDILLPFLWICGPVLIASLIKLAYPGQVVNYLHKLFAFSWELLYYQEILVLVVVLALIFYLAVFRFEVLDRKEVVTGLFALTFLGLCAFSQPSGSWHQWSMPFLILALCQHRQTLGKMLVPFFGFQLAYLAYFTFIVHSAYFKGFELLAQKLGVTNLAYVQMGTLWHAVEWRAGRAAVIFLHNAAFSAMFASMLALMAVLGVRILRQR